MNREFWALVDRLVAESTVVIDRPKGSCHPRYPHIVYPLDYGYLDNTTSMDAGGIDIWIGSSANRQVDALICTVDLLKRDSEIKLLLRCTEEEKATVLSFHNESEYMKGILIPREKE